jgi:hypothetical protein
LILQDQFVKRVQIALLGLLDQPLLIHSLGQ